MTAVFKLSQELMHAADCITCGVPIVMPAVLERTLRANHAYFHCVHGHSQCWPQQSELEKTKELLASERRWRELAQQGEAAAKKAAEAARATAEKVTNRAAVGLCVCCNRSFRNLARHMKAKHPTEGGGRNV